MDVFSQAAQKIIREQENIIGPVAIERAQRVQGIKLNVEKREVVALEGDKPVILQKLIEQYEQLFGRASVEVCKEAVGALIPQMPEGQVPALLK
jgi:hypothetical protein